MVAALSCDAVQLTTSSSRPIKRSCRLQIAPWRISSGLERQTGTEDFTRSKAACQSLSMAKHWRHHGYCTSAKEVFAVALDTAKTTWRISFRQQTTSADSTFAPCQFRTASLEDDASPRDSCPALQAGHDICGRRFRDILAELILSDRSCRPSIIVSGMTCFDKSPRRWRKKKGRAEARPFSQRVAITGEIDHGTTVLGFTDARDR